MTVDKRGKRENLHLKVQQGPEHGLPHPLLLCDALVEGGRGLLAGAAEGVAIPLVDLGASGDVHVNVVGGSKVLAPGLQHAQPVLQVRQADPGPEEGSLGSHIPAASKAPSEHCNARAGYLRSRLMRLCSFLVLWPRMQTLAYLEDHIETGPFSAKV